jgi:hypothetical protein
MHQLRILANIICRPLASSSPITPTSPASPLSLAPKQGSIKENLTENSSQLHHRANTGNRPRLPEVLMSNHRFGNALSLCSRRAFFLEEVEDQQPAVELEG